MSQARYSVGVVRGRILENEDAEGQVPCRRRANKQIVVLAVATCERGAAFSAAAQLAVRMPHLALR